MQDSVLASIKVLCSFRLYDLIESFKMNGKTSLVEEQKRSLLACKTWLQLRSYLMFLAWEYAFQTGHCDSNFTTSKSHFQLFPQDGHKTPSNAIATKQIQPLHIAYRVQQLISHCEYELAVLASLRIVDIPSEEATVRCHHINMPSPSTIKLTSARSSHFIYATRIARARGCII